MSVVAAVWKARGLWGLHVVVNAVLLFLIYEWLAIPDRTVLYLALSAISGLVFIALTLWLHAATLAHFRAVHEAAAPTLRATFKATLGKLLPIALWFGVLLLAAWLALAFGGYLDSGTNWTASSLTFRLRRPVTPAFISTVFSWIIAALTFVVVPVICLPLGSRVASEGFAGFSLKSLRGVRSIRYWLAYVALFVVGTWIPYNLVWWIPEVEGFYVETISLVLRVGLAYLVAVTTWLLVASLVGSDRPSWTGGVPEGRGGRSITKTDCS